MSLEGWSWPSSSDHPCNHPFHAGYRNPFGQARSPPLGTRCKAQETVVEGGALLTRPLPPRSSRARSRGAPVRPREPSPAAQRGRARRGPTTPRRVRFRLPSRHLGRRLRVKSQPTQCQTLRSGQGDAAPPLNPQLPAPLPGQRAVGAAVAAEPPGQAPSGATGHGSHAGRACAFPCGSVVIIELTDSADAIPAD